MTSSDEQEIQALLAEGNDEQVVRLLYTLAQLKPSQTKFRVVFMEELGERYLTLGLARESIAQNIEEAITRLYDGSLVIPPEASRDASALGWYDEAIRYLEEALAQMPETFNKEKTIRLACLAHALSVSGGRERLKED
jgi:tetratricopeptide (TPR) repeat protein